MFTGLIEDIGRLDSIERGPDGARVRIATALGGELGVGDSIAVDGVCLTATAADRAGFEAEVMNQTLRVSGLDELKGGSGSTWSWRCDPPIDSAATSWRDTSISGPR